jgi:hypothetical protein
MQISLEALKQMKDAGLSKPDFVTENEWLACDEIGTVVNVPAVTQTTTPAVAEPVSNQAQFIPQALTLDDLDQTGMAVDMIMKIKTGSIFLDKDEIVQPLMAKVLWSECKVKQTIKVDLGNGKSEYFHTYDGVNEVRGGTYDSKVRYCQKIDPNAFSYVSVDMVLELTEDAKDSRGNVVAKAGTRLGHSTSATARNSIKDLRTACKKAEIDTANGEANVKITLETKKNDKFTWKIPVFELVG